MVDRVLCGLDRSATVSYHLLTCALVCICISIGSSLLVQYPQCIIELCCAARVTAVLVLPKIYQHLRCLAVQGAPSTRGTSPRVLAVCDHNHTDASHGASHCAGCALMAPHLRNHSTSTQHHCTAEGSATVPAASQVPTDDASPPPPAEVSLDLEAEVVTSISKVDQEAWDACATSGGSINPFVLWSFLHALEESGSAVRAPSTHFHVHLTLNIPFAQVAEEGWLPQHVLVRRRDTRELLGACPMYLKSHSYGEYVFDHSWAGAWLCGRSVMCVELKLHRTACSTTHTWIPCHGNIATTAACHFHTASHRTPCRHVPPGGYSLLPKAPVMRALHPCHRPAPAHKAGPPRRCRAAGPCIDACARGRWVLRFVREAGCTSLSVRVLGCACAAVKRACAGKAMRAALVSVTTHPQTSWACPHCT